MIRVRGPVWLCLLPLFLLSAFAQDIQPQRVSPSKEIASGSVLISGNPMFFADSLGTASNSFELVVSGTPATLTANVYGCGRGGTCNATALATNSGTGNQFLVATGSFDRYEVVASWTGGSSPSLLVNRTGITAAGGGSGGPASSVSVTNFPATQPVSGTVTAAQSVAANLNATVTGTVNTQPSGFASVISFQQAVTASAVVLATNAVHGFCVKALPTNAISVFVGPSGVSTATGYPLAAGDSICYQASNTNVAFVIASATGASVAISGN